MAGSFHVFRKNQKLFMALAAIMAIFVFVFADLFTSWLQKSASNAQGSPSTTLVTWDGGSISTSELKTLGRRRTFISDFLRALFSQGVQTVISEGGTPLEPTVPSFVLEQENLNFRAVMFGTVTTRILSELATEAGMTVSDKMINDYLREFGSGKVTDTEIAEILKRTSRTTASYGEQQLFAGLRELLLKNNYMRSYMSVIQNVMPEQRWDDWQQINRRIALEAAVFPTQQFLGEVAEPTDLEIQELYDQFKDQLGYRPERIAGGAQMNSPDPGFRVPQKVRMQFLKGDVNEWTEKMLDQVTDEEIADYYERNKRTQFVEVDLFSTDSTEEETSETEESPEESTEESTEKKPEADETEAKESDEAAAKESESSEEAPQEAPQEVTEEVTEEESENNPSEEPAEESESTEPETTEPEPTESASEEAKPAPAADESSSVRPTSPFRLVSLQEESGEEAEESSAEEAPAEEEAAPAEAEPAEETPEESEPIKETPETAPGESPEESSDDSQEEADAEEKPVEYTPLEEVSDEIRRRLANDKAVVELEKVMGRAFAELQSEYNRYGGDLVRAKTEERDPPAPPAKLAKLETMAADLGLISEVLVPSSYSELLKTSVGKATDAQTKRIPVVNAAFAKSHLELYEPFLAQDLDGDWFLAIKVEDLESNVPALEEVRDDVVSAWKTREAAKLALERSKMLATEAEKTGETLAGFFADKNFEVVTTDLFSRLTFGSTTPMEMRQGARLGEAPPLAAVDIEFMDEAFDLKADQVVAMLNHDQTFAYVLRLVRREKTEAELRQLFLLEANEWFGGRVMRDARMQNAQRNLMGQLTQRVGLDISGLEEYFQPDDR